MADVLNSSCCDPDNGDKPGQPEYGKKKKPENHRGCCCNDGGCDEPEVAEPPTIVRQTLTREDFA